MAMKTYYVLHTVDGSYGSIVAQNSRGTGFESRPGQMFVSEVVHIHCSNLFKGLEYAMLSTVGLLYTARNPWSHSIRVEQTSDFRFSSVAIFPWICRNRHKAIFTRMWAIFFLYTELYSELFCFKYYVSYIFDMCVYSVYWQFLVIPPRMPPETVQTTLYKKATTIVLSVAGLMSLVIRVVVLKSAN